MEELPELPDIEDGPVAWGIYYYEVYSEPVMEYVSDLAEDYKLPDQIYLDKDFHISRSAGTFAIRYLQNKIDKSALQKYLDAKEVQETIAAMGYDADKFWYLLMFIFDYSSGIRYQGIKPNDAPKEQIIKLIEGIAKNFNPSKLETDEYIFDTPTKIVLDIEHKHKITIDNPVALYWLVSVCHSALKRVKKGSRMATRVTDLDVNKYDQLKKSDQIWYFAKMFNSFFELRAPKPVRQKKGTTNSYNKNLLIGRLIYMLGISDNINFNDSEDTLNGFIKQYKNSEIDWINGLYI